MGVRRNYSGLLRLSLLITSGALALAPLGESPGARPASTERTVCTADISFPLEVHLTPLDAPRPGFPLRVRVDVESRIPVDAVEVSVEAPAEIPVLTGRRIALGEAGPLRGRSHEFTLSLPGDRSRRTVDVVVRATQDDRVLSRGATLNLNFEEEPSRVVPGPDGTLVREVPARKVR